MNRGLQLKLTADVGQKATLFTVGFKKVYFNISRKIDGQHQARQSGPGADIGHTKTLWAIMGKMGIELQGIQQVTIQSPCKKVWADQIITA